MSAAKHTPGPWRWQFNAEHRRLHLVGGDRRFDLTIIDFERWGMSGATMRLRDTAHDGLQLLYRVHERPDWIAPEPGREHHKNWHQLLTHPDARLIEAAPDLLDAARKAREALAVALSVTSPDLFETDADIAEHLTIKVLDDAIAKATGSAS